MGRQELFLKCVKALAVMKGDTYRLVVEREQALQIFFEPKFNDT